MAADKAAAMHHSFHWALWSAVIAGVVLLAIVTHRHLPMVEQALAFARMRG